MTHDTLKAIAHEAEMAVPFECCGVIGNDGLIIPCENTAKDRQLGFMISREELKRVQRDHGIAGYYHSHVGSAATPSSADVTGPSYPGQLYVIASVVAGRCRNVEVYRYSTKGFVRENVGCATLS